MQRSHQITYWLFLISLLEMLSCNREALGVVGGWFARSADVLRQVGDVLLDPASQQDQPLKRWLTAADAFEQCDKATGQAIYKARCTPLRQTFYQWCFACMIPMKSIES